MKISESSFSGAAGTLAHTIEWAPEGEPIADIVLVHGYGEHSGRYTPWAQRFVDLGYRVSALDHRGHGRTSGVARGVVDSFEYLVDDVSSFVDIVRADRPLFVYGHSMGGLAVARLIERDDSRFAGAILTGPALAVAGSVPAPLVKLANIIGQLAPNLGTIKLDGNAISRDDKVRADYDADPLNYRGKMTAGTGRQLSITMAAAHAEAGRISIPVLVLHGEADALAAVSGSVDFIDECGSADKGLRTWPEAYHELHHEPEADEVFGVIAEWLADHR